LQKQDLHLARSHGLKRNNQKLNPDSTQGRNEVRWCPGQEASLAPHVQSWSLSEAYVLYWRQELSYCWDFSAPPAVIRRL